MTIRVGLIGGGEITGSHLRALASVRGLEVAGLVSRAAPNALADLVRANGLGPGVVYPSLEALATEVDVVAIFAPNFTRLAIAEALARAVARGASLRAIVCEKPLGRNLRESRQMVAIAEEMGVQTVYFENQLHMPAIKGTGESPHEALFGVTLRVSSQRERSDSE